MEKMKNILFTVITSIISLGVIAFAIISCINSDGSLIEKILGVIILFTAGGGYDIVLNLYWWGLI